MATPTGSRLAHQGPPGCRPRWPGRVPHATVPMSSSWSRPAPSPIPRSWARGPSRQRVARASTKLEIAVAPDRHQSVVSVAHRGAADPALPRPPIGPGGQRPGAPAARRRAHPGGRAHTFRVSAGVFWQVHVGAAEALAQRGAGRPRRRSPATAWSTCTPAPGCSRWSWPTRSVELGSVLAVERDRRACADADTTGAPPPTDGEDAPPSPPGSLRQGSAGPICSCSTRPEKAPAGT